MASPLKLAIPSTAFTVVVPNSVPPPGFVPMASVTGSRAPATRAPAASWISTCTAGEIVPSMVVVVGCTVNASWAGTVGAVGPVSPPHPAPAAANPPDRSHHALRATDLELVTIGAASLLTRWPSPATGAARRRYSPPLALQLAHVPTTPRI